MAYGASNRDRSCLEYYPGKQVLLLFGGLDFGNKTYFGDLWIYSISQNRWDQEVQPTVIGPRIDHACAIDPESGSFFVHGGSYSFTYYSDLVKYNIETKKWSLVDPGNSLVLLNSHKMVFSQQLSSLFVFMGYNHAPQIQSYVSDIYRFNFRNVSYGWSLYAVQGLGPPSRGLFTMGYNPITGEYYILNGDGPMNSGITSMNIAY